MKRRLFVAVDPSPSARERLAELSEALRHASQETGMRLRFVRPENLHLTLRFLGDVDEERIPELAAVLGEVAATDRFEIGFSGLGAFPSEKKSKVIWVGLGQGLAPLKTLAEQVDRCLQEVGIAPEARPFRPHLTLARTKKGSENSSRLMKLVSSQQGASSLVQEVVLYQSDLGPRGATYRARARISLE